MSEPLNKDLYKTQLRLARKLVAILDNENFVDGVMNLIDHPDDIEAMIDFIDNQPEEATPSNITKFAVVMCNDRDGGENEDVDDVDDV